MQPPQAAEPAKDTKVFCIGFHKTGTRSLGTALTTLGYRLCGPFGFRDPDIRSRALGQALATAPQHDAFRGNPWSILFRDLDRAFPGSRFILTVREPGRWFVSALKHFGERSTPMREWIYGAGSPLGNEAVYLERFNRHEREVREHFSGAGDRLLVMDIEAGDDWGPLCEFLDQQVPDAPFPHVGRRADLEPSGPA